MSDNVINMPTPLNVLADRLRKAFDQRDHHIKGWIGATIDLCLTLREARDRFPSNPAFSAWLGENDLDDLGKNDRAAALNLASNPALLPIALADTASRSLRLIWTEWEERYSHVPSVGNMATEVTTDSVPAEIEIEEPPQVIFDPPESDKPEVTKATAAPFDDAAISYPARVGLIKNHGKHGEAVYRWLVAGKGKTMHAAMYLAREKRGTVAKLAAFLAEPRNPALPLPNKSSREMSLILLWREAPTELLLRFGTIAKVIEGWDTHIAPHYAAWLVDKPENVNAWYFDRMQAAVDARRKEAVESAPALVNGEPAPNPAEKTVIDKAFRPSREGRVVFLGKQLWPKDDADYEFADVWYALKLWRAIDASLAIGEPNRARRATPFHSKDVAACMRAFNPRVGRLWWTIVAHQASGADGETTMPHLMLQFGA